MRNDVAAFRDEAEHVYADMKAAGYNDELFSRTVQSLLCLFMTSPSVEEVKFIDFAPLAVRLEPMATNKEGYGDAGCNERIDNGEAKGIQLL